MILDITETLNGIGDFVNSCLAMLGVGDFASITGEQWAQWGIDFAIQIVATLVLFLLVRFLLWKPLTKMIEARKEKIDSELNQAEEANAKAQELKLSLEDQLADAQEHVKGIIAKAEKEGNERREKIISEAKAEAQRRIDESVAQVDKEIANKQKEIKDTIVSVAFDAASKILEKEVDKDKYLDLVNQIIEGANIK
jgi:F-type H+-transporting ATPase subunit b